MKTNDRIIILMEVKHLKRLLAAALILTVLSVPAYSYIEGALATAATDSDQVVVTLSVNEEIDISDSANTSMSQSLGITANTAIATSSWTVITNSSAGYTVAVKASTDPAMQTGGGDVVADYTEAVSGTPDTWSVPSGAAEFGYSAFSSSGRVATTTWGTGTQCSSTANVPSTTLKYIDFDTSDRTIASHTATTTPSGDSISLCYAVEQDGFLIADGTYTATITATATTQ
jgi:hypothetical protein